MPRAGLLLVRLAEAVGGGGCPRGCGVFSGLTGDAESCTAAPAYVGDGGGSGNAGGIPLQFYYQFVLLLLRWKFS